MQKSIFCPDCKRTVAYDPYFKARICRYCGEDIEVPEESTRKNVYIEIDPIELVMEAFTQLYPDKKAIIKFSGGIAVEGILETYGETVFPEDGFTPIVLINPSLAYQDFIEIMAHELAHVAEPEDRAHGSLWEKAFEAIHLKYSELGEAKVRALENV